MAKLPLDQAVTRFQNNEERMDTFANGNASAEYLTTDGATVPSISKFLATKDNAINIGATSILTQANAAKDSAAASAATAAGLAVSVVTLQNDLAATTGATLVGFAPAGNISASTVRNAIVELDNEKAPINSPAFTGTPTAPTQLTADNSTAIATTAWVKAQPTGAGDMILASIQTVTGAKTFNTNTLKLAGSTSGAATLNAPAVAGANVYGLPAGSDTLVGLASTDSLSNKTLVAPVLGVATATSVNKFVLTSPATSATINTRADNLTHSLPAASGNLALEQLQQNSQSAAYTLVIGDAGKQIYHPSADTTARTWTIPANASVAYPIGTGITFINDTGAGVVTLAITTDTLKLAGAGTVGSRTLAANGIATAIKMTSTSWIISGVGLT